ncbi:glucose-6-phosphate isomerase [Hyphomicrobium methylovorum]|uniref:glucose-6-phosphate isomerase n=1 Tax=Hyphomicrobium methylovorum TaxID=84 RepID=UPI0015E639C3|nr:glucose-6-phosphate isomerase [Hyphomicrobium methylovorum]MBA2126845.1 glucose-6-phosphate isomerase [Hyphomicrobium methylovorum]
MQDGQNDVSGFKQNIDGCLDAVIGEHGLSRETLQSWLKRMGPHVEALKNDYREERLGLLRIAEETADIDAAEAALARLSVGAQTIVFFGTGGSSLGGQTLAQLAGWKIPGVATEGQKSRPRTRFYDNLDGRTLEGVLNTLDLRTTRFIVTSKSGGTAETLAQAIAALSAVKAAGLEAEIPKLFLGITEPDKPGKANGLRALFSRFNIPMLEHHTGIGGRFSCLTNVGLMPAIARGLDVRAIRAGAKSVIDALLAAKSAEDFQPAVGAATAVALSKEKGIKTLVLMPYTDRLGRLSAWFVQLWAESLGKGGEGTTPVGALGPLDQHSQLQLFMDGPREHYITILRVPSAGVGPKIDKELAQLAGADMLGGHAIGDIVEAQAHAVPDALAQAQRPVRTIDVAKLDEKTLGALLMHFMIETILAGRLLGLDPFDQPAVELAKVLTRERLASGA